MIRFCLLLNLALMVVSIGQDVEIPLEETQQEEAPAVPPPAPLLPPVVSAPDGFPQGSILPALSDLRDGLSLGVSSSFVYDSNVNPGLGGSQGEGDMIFTVGPTVAYRSRGSDWHIGTNVAVNYATYFDNSDLGGLGYTANLEVGYDGKPLTVLGTFGSSLTNGTNRNYGSYSETLNYTTALSASYRWSAKTSLDARFNYQWTDPGDAVSATGTAYGGSESTSFDLSAMWRATPLVRIGPGIRWSWESGDNQVDRETVGPMVRLQYQLAKKVSLDGTFGVDFVDYAGAGGGDDTAFSTQLGLTYQASKIWGMNLSISQGTTADGSAAGTYRENLAVRLGYHHRIRRAILALGLGYETNDSVNTGGTTVAGGVGDYVTFNASLGMPILRNRVMASTFFDLREATGGDANGDSDGYRIGLSLSSNF